MILVTESIRTPHFTEITSVSNVYNVCATKIIGSKLSVLLASVYHAPWASAQETCDLFDCLCKLCVMVDEPLIVGDFNQPGIDWKCTYINYSSSLELFSKLFMNEIELQQIKTSPNCSGNMLDVLLVSESFT